MEHSIQRKGKEVHQFYRIERSCICWPGGRGVLYIWGDPKCLGGHSTKFPAMLDFAQ